MREVTLATHMLFHQTWAVIALSVLQKILRRRSCDYTISWLLISCLVPVIISYVYGLVFSFIWRNVTRATWLHHFALVIDNLNSSEKPVAMHSRVERSNGRCIIPRA